MPTVVPTDRLMEGHRPSAMPPIGPDGAPELAPAPTAPLARAPISRCQLGPCRNLHTLESQIDAQGALDGTDVFHTGITRTCYPAPGVEMDLTGGPVRECSRWSPLTVEEARDLVKRRGDWVNPKGSHRADLDAFEASWAAIATTDDDEEG